MSERMDNSQFRSLINQKSSNASPHTASGISRSGLGLGSRPRNAFPMTPRSVASGSRSGVFSAQVAAYAGDANGEPPKKKFKSSAAPKGTKLASGYVDRTTLRQQDNVDDEEGDDLAVRLKALEEMYKLGQIDDQALQKLREELGVGGDTSSTHLVKGLDWKLLERVRKGEDVTKSVEAPGDGEERAAEVEDELEKALNNKAAAIVRETSPSPERDDHVTGPMAPSTRDEILRRLKESRKMAAQPSAPDPSLSGKFKKISAPDKAGKKKYVESVNGRRREVLVIVGKDGKTKRKTRWLDPESAATETGVPWGLEVPAEVTDRQKVLQESVVKDEEDDDIFAGAADYDPLAEIGSGESDTETAKQQANNARPDQSEHPSGTHKTRGYFLRDDNDEATSNTRSIAEDPTILAALKRAAQIRQREISSQEANDEGTDPEKQAKRNQFLQKLREQERQDAGDMDLGFGDSRFGDEDDEEGLMWDDEENSKKASRKRGPKKRKGDKDSAQDVLNVLQSRQAK